MVMTVGMVDPKASDMGARAGANQGGVVWSPGASPPTWACLTTVGWSWQQSSQRWPQGGGQSGLSPWPLGRLGQRVRSSCSQMHRPGGPTAPGRKGRGGPRHHGGGDLHCSWGPWVSPALGREPVTSEPHTRFFLPIGLCL